MNRMNRTLATLVVAFTVASSCGRDADRAATTTTAAAISISSNDAVARVTSARCTREAGCNNVGSDRRFVDREACTRALRGDTEATLGEEVCPHGIDGSRLATCLSELRREICDSALQSLDRLLSCRKVWLCL